MRVMPADAVRDCAESGRAGFRGSCRVDKRSAIHRGAACPARRRGWWTRSTSCHRLAVPTAAADGRRDHHHPPTYDRPTRWRNGASLIRPSVGSLIPFLLAAAAFAQAPAASRPPCRHRCGGTAAGHAGQGVRRPHRGDRARGNPRARHRLSRRRAVQGRRPGQGRRRAVPHRAGAVPIGGAAGAGRPVARPGHADQRLVAAQARRGTGQDQRHLGRRARQAPGGPADRAGRRADRRRQSQDGADQPGLHRRSPRRSPASSAAPPSPRAMSSAPTAAC